MAYFRQIKSKVLQNESLFVLAFSDNARKIQGCFDLLVSRGSGGKGVKTRIVQERGRGFQSEMWLLLSGVHQQK